MQCNICKFDCKYESVRCENFKAAMPTYMYVREIKNKNINLKQFAKDNDLNYKILMKMLKEEIPMNYKYSVKLDVLMGDAYEE